LPDLDVPTLPVAHLQAFALLRDLDPSVHELATLAETDPSLTGSLIRVANSAVSSPLSRVATPRDAIVRLGVTEARRLIISVALSRAFVGLRGSNIDEPELWRHLVAVAVLADTLSWGQVRGTEAFTAGLLHDIGRLAMAAQHPTKYAGVVRAAHYGIDTDLAERRVFGLTHVEWGATIGRQWGFPDQMVEAISSHHDGESSALGWVVMRAREVAESLGIGDGVRPPTDLPPDAEEFDPVVHDLGGAESVLMRVERFRSALAA
jgi:putative nucleotidyltransferase with HDIG domain